MSIIVKAPAKINLYLDVVGKSENGYHRVEMIMQTVSLYDVVKVEKNKISKISIFSNYNFSKNITKNTAYKAAVEFFKYTNTVGQGVNIQIKKRIPVCAGLAGGSSDAAATLVALNSLFDTRLSKGELSQIGGKIGADVPFCIYGGTMISTGIGTELSPINKMPFCHVVLCKPNIYVSTKKAYSLSDNFKIRTKSIKPIVYAINRKSLDLIGNSLYNHFEYVLSSNEVYNIKCTMIQNGAIASCMSGSGPTVFGLFKEKKLAESCVNKLSKTYKSTFLCNPIDSGAFIIDKK